jgi:hypothetical protein
MCSIYRDMGNKAETGSEMCSIYRDMGKFAIDEEIINVTCTGKSEIH